MESIFPFGCRYADTYPSTPGEWEQDMKLMRYLRFNTVRIPVIWGVVEKVRCQLDFTVLDGLLEMAEKYSLRPILAFQFRCAPEWAVRRHPNYWYKNAAGQMLVPSPSPDVPTGGWPGLCPDHAEVRTMEGRFIRMVCQHVGLRAWAWEPGDEATAPFFPDDRGTGGMTCYCDTTQRHFREWVLRKYSLAEKVSEAWHMPIDSPEAIRPPAGRSNRFLFEDWRNFSSERAAYAMKRRSDVIRKTIGGKILVSSPDGGSILWTDPGIRGADDWKQSGFADLCGSSFTLADFPDLPKAALSAAWSRSAAREKEFWQTGLGTPGASGGFLPVREISPELFTMGCWEMLSQGIHGLMMRSFRKTGSGSQTLTDAGGNLTSLASACQKIGHILEDYGYTFMSAQPTQAECALLYTPESRLAEYTENGNAYLTVGSLRGIARALWDGSIPFDVLHPAGITKKALEKYRCLFLPSAAFLPPSLIPLLAGYVRNGGTLFGDPLLAMLDREKSSGFPRRFPGGGLNELFGAEGQDLSVLPDNELCICRGGNLFPIRSCRFRMRIKPLTATVWAEFQDGLPAVLVNPVGKGRTVLSAAELGLPALMEKEAENPAAQLIRKFVSLAGVTPPLVVPSPLRGRLLRAKHADILVVYDFAGNGGTYTVVCRDGGEKRWAGVTSRDKGHFSEGRITLTWEPRETKVLFIEK